MLVLKDMIKNHKEITCSWNGWQKNIQYSGSLQDLVWPNKHKIKLESDNVQVLTSAVHLVV